MEKRVVKVLELAYRLAYGLGASFLIAAMVVGLSVGTSSSASAAPEAQADKVVWCHCGGNGECRTIEISENALENAGHIDAQGNILHGGDHRGACADPTDEPTAEPTDPSPTATTPSSDPGETPTVAAPSGGDDDSSSAVIIPVTGVSVIEGGESSRSFLQSAGFGLLGLGLLLQGIAVKKRREVA